MGSGLVVLSIYCAQMAPKWNRLQELRPKQGKDMSVQAYYDEFCDWKEKMEEQNYLADEQSYIDDFLCWLKWDLAVRVWSYDLKPRKLSDAFYRARFEELMIEIKANLDKSFDTVTLKSISMVPDKFSAQMDGEAFDEGREMEATKEDLGRVLNTNQLSFPKAGNEMVDKVRQPHSLKLGSLQDERHMFHEMSRPFLVGQSGGNAGNIIEETVGLPLIDLQSVLSSLGATTINVSSKGSIKAWFEDSASAMKAVLSQNATDPLAHKVFYEMSQLFRAVLTDEQVNDPYTNGFNFNKFFILFDPGGGREYVPSYGRGPLISKAHGTCINGMKGPVSSLRHVPSTIISGDKHCLVASDHFQIFSSVSHPIFALIVDSIAHEDDSTLIDLKSLFDEADYEFVMAMLSFNPGGCSLLLKISNGKYLTTGLIHYHEEMFLRGHKIGVLVEDTIFENLVWDPGLCVCFVYILEDKDVLKRKGIGIRLALKKIGSQIHHTVIRMECSGSDPFMTNPLEHFYSTHGDVEGWKSFSVIPSNGVILWIYKPSVHDAKSLCHDITTILCSKQLWDDYPSASLFLVIPYFSISTYNSQIGEQVHVINFGTKWSIKWQMLFQALVHLQEFGWEVDKNACVELVFRKVIVNSFKDLRKFMFDIYKDEVVTANFEGKFYQLLVWSRVVKNVVSFEERYKMRKQGWYSTVWLAWYTQFVEYIALHYTKATMDKDILLKQLVIWELDWICVVKHEDILFILMTGVLVLLLYFAVAMMIFVLAILKNFAWDPGLVSVSHFTTLRTRRLLRGRICHVPRSKFREITEESIVAVTYELLAV